MYYKEKIWDFCAIIIGSLFVAISINFFISSHSLSFGGVTGLSLIVREIFGIPINVFYFILSLSLLLIGGIKKGKDFFLKTLFATIAISFIFIPLTKNIQVESHIIVAAICGAVFLGLGVGIILRHGGSTSGPDLIAALFKEKIPEKFTMLIIDGVIFISGLIVFGPNNLYSIIIIVLTPLTVGNVLKIKRASLLINPRKNDGFKGSFANKIVNTNLAGTN